MPYLCARANSQFSSVYMDPRYSDWLKAHISIMLIAAGFAPSYGVKFINRWLRDEDKYDPYNQATTLHELLKTAKPHQQHDESEPLPNHMLISFRLLLPRLGF